MASIEPQNEHKNDNILDNAGMYFGGDGAWSPRVITCFGRTFFDVALTRDR